MGFIGKRLLVILLISIAFLQFYIASREFNKLSEDDAMSNRRLRLVAPVHQTTTEPAPIAERLRTTCENYSAEIPSTLSQDIQIALMTKDRPQQLRKTIEELVCKSRIRPEQIIVFSDTEDETMILETQKVCLDFNVLVVFDFARDSTTGHLIMKTTDTRIRLTRHYQYAFKFIFGDQVANKQRSSSQLESILKRPQANYIIIMEDDLSVSPDFGDYFSTLATKMNEDDSIFCASAWNDNAYPGTAVSTRVVKRGRHFMALGWMFSAKNYFEHIAHSWQTAENPVDWDRPFAMVMYHNDKIQCVYPEVPRTHHRAGDERKAYSTSNHFQTSRLDNMILANNLNFDALNIETLSPSEVYDEYIRKEISEATLIRSIFPQVHWYFLRTLVFLCETCGSHDGWDSVMKDELGLFGIGFDGIVRGVYKNVVSLRIGTNHLYLVSKTSPFAEHINTAQVEENESRNFDPTVISQADGAVEIISAGPKVSCAEACQQKPEMFCNEQIWSRINTCSYLNAEYQCKSCKQSETAHGPTVTASGECQTALLRSLNCKTVASDRNAKLVCACVTKVIAQRIEKL